MKIFIWGTGHVAHSYLCQNEVTEKDIVGFIQTNRTLKEWKGIKVYKPDEIEKIAYDYILVCIYGDARNIINTCNKNKIPLEKVLLIDNYEWIDGSSMRNIPESLYQSIQISNGVYRGEFARLINARFKERKMYLFDTFESFDKNEYIDELASGNCSEGFRETFTDTSIEKVLHNMIYPEQCIPRVGFFPDTAIGLEEERYAFVSIDVDFEKSILEGLRYFYPRMSEGGRIFIHDYNNCFLGGVKTAVDKYEIENEMQIVKIPIADEGGTLIIVKQ